MLNAKTGRTQDQTQEPQGRSKGFLKGMQSMMVGGVIVATAMLASTAHPAHAGAVHCPKQADDTVLAYDTDAYDVTFRGGEEAVIAVSGNGDTDLDLYVYDEDGELVEYDDDPGDDCRVTFFVPDTETYTIRIKNHGSVDNDYEMATN